MVLKKFSIILFIALLFNSLSAYTPYKIKCYDIKGKRISCDSSKVYKIKKIPIRKKKKTYKVSSYKKKYNSLKAELARIKRKQALLESDEIQIAEEQRIKLLKKLENENKQLREEIAELKKLILESKKANLANTSTDNSNTTTASNTTTTTSSTKITSNEQTAKTTKTTTLPSAPEETEEGTNLPAPSTEKQNPIKKIVEKEKKEAKEGKEEKDEDKSGPSLTLEGGGSKKLNDTDSTMSYWFDLNISYKLLDTLSLSIIPGASVSPGTDDSAGSASLNDLLILLEHDFYKNDYLSLAAKYHFFLPTSQGSQDSGQLLGFKFVLTINIPAFHDKGYLRFEPEFAFAIREYTTAPPSDNPSPDDIFVYKPLNLQFEKLDPYEKYSTALKIKLGYSLNKTVSFATHLKIKGWVTYADEVLYDGQLITITPEEWHYRIYFGLPIFGFSVSKNLYFEAYVETSSSAEDFSFFGSENTDTFFGFYVGYSL